jgi:hypothetical protein
MHPRLLELQYPLIREPDAGPNKCRQVEILLVVRGGEHEERPSENDPEALERVSIVLG